MDFDLHDDNGAGTSIWLNRSTLWVLDETDTYIYAYTLSDGGRDSAKDIDLHTDNGFPTGIWSDGSTMWVLDLPDTYIYAYRLTGNDRGSRDPTKDIDLHNDNTDPRGLWSNGTILWVGGVPRRRVYAYMLEGGNRDQSSEFVTYISDINNAADSNSTPYGIWSDSTTMWVSDSVDTYIYAYRLSDGHRIRAQEFDLNDGEALGIASNGSTLWVTDQGEDKLFAYALPPFPTSTDTSLSALSISQGSLSPAFAAGTTSYTAEVANTVTSLTVTPTGTENTVAITVNGEDVTSGKTSDDITVSPSANTITIVVTSPDLTTTQTYTLTVNFVEPPQAQVTNVMVTAGGGQLAVSWDAVTEANGYKVQWKSGSQNYDDPAREHSVTDGMTTSYTIPNLTNGTTYTVRVIATRTGANDGDPSAEVTGTPMMPSPTATLILSPATIDEGMGTATVTATLNRMSSAEVTLTVSAMAVAPAVADDFILSTDKVLTIAMGQTASTGTVTITAEDNNIDAAADKTVTVSATVGGNSGIANPMNRTLTITDDDTADVRLTPNALSVLEGGSMTEYTIRLESEPTADVMVTLRSDTPAAATVEPTSLTFTTGNWNVPQTVTVTGVNNDIEDPGGERTATISHTFSGGGYNSISGSVTVQVTDDDAAGVVVTPRALTVTEAAGTTRMATYTVRLSSAPTGNVTITPSSSAPDAATVSGALTFTDSDWSTEQTVTVTNVTGSADISHTVTATGTDYDSVTAAPVMISSFAALDINRSGVVDATDPLLIFYVLNFTATIDDDAALRNRLMVDQTGSFPNNDTGFKAIISEAKEWANNPAHDVNGSGRLDATDPLLVFYVLNFIATIDDDAALRNRLMVDQTGRFPNNDTGFKQLIAEIKRIFQIR